MNKKILGLTIAAAFTAGNAQAVVIDDFDGGGLSVAAPGSINVDYAGAIGGSHTVDIRKSGPLGAEAQVLIPPGIYSHSADALTSATSTITWDANGAGLGGVDLVEGLIDNAFLFDIISIDQGFVDLTITATDTSGGSNTSTLSGAGVGLQTFAYSNFAGVDFTSIESLSLQVVGGEASDLTLDSLGTTGNQPPEPPVVSPVPEPAPLALLSAGLLALGLRRKAQ